MTRTAMHPGSTRKGRCCMTRSRKGARDSMYYYKWLDKALCDLQAARILLTWGGDPSNVAFHCQQAIEKALKGYLLFRTGRHYDGHNLTYLCRAGGDGGRAVYRMAGRECGAEQPLHRNPLSNRACRSSWMRARCALFPNGGRYVCRHPQGIIRRRPSAPDQKIARAAFLKNKKAFPFR